MSETITAALEREHHEIDDAIAAYVAAGGGDGTALAAALHELRRHIYAEEQLLFPPLRAAGMMAPILVMLREHGQMWHLLGQLDADLAAGDHAKVVASCAELATLLDSHNAKEEVIVYPEGERVLAGAAGEQIREFLKSGQLPADWVCAQGGA